MLSPIFSIKQSFSKWWRDDKHQHPPWVSKIPLHLWKAEGENLKLGEEDIYLGSDLFP